MLGHRELSFEEYVGILRRRKWWIIIPAILAPLIGFGISLKLPNRFTSQTLVLVEQQKVPDDFVRPVVTEQLNERLATMQEQILSRTRLQPIIERFGLFAEEGNLPMEEKVDRMRKTILVTAVRGDFGNRAGGLPGFYISFTAPTARLAQQVCGEITSMFMEENLRVRERAAQGTTEFLKTQLDDAKRKLDDQDSRLATFKKKYIGQMPGQDQTNFNMLTSLNTQLQASTEAISRMQQERTYVESMLAAQLQQLSLPTDTVATGPNSLQQQLAAEQAQLVTLKSKYTDTHPDVVKLQHDIDLLKKRIEDSNAQAAAAPTKPATNRPAIEPASIQQLRAQLKVMDQGIRDKQKEQEKLQSDIKMFQARIQLSPVVEEEYKGLTRDYQTALDFYSDLLKKKTESEMATDLERRQQGEQFRVMDPPNLPEKPTFPNRPLFAAGGFGGGLALGFAIAFLLEMRDKSVRSEQDVQFYLQLPTLAMMPSVPEGNLEKSGFMRRLLTRKRGNPQPYKPHRQAVGA